MKRLSTDKFINGLAVLYGRLIELGVQYWGGKVCLDDLDELDETNPP